MKIEKTKENLERDFLIVLLILKNEYKRLQTNTSVYSTATPAGLSHICIVNND